MDSFQETISIIADYVTLLGVITVIPFALLKRRENLIGFRINLFVHYLFRTAIILMVSIILYKVTDLFYYLFIVMLKGGAVTDNTEYWEEGKELHHILAYFITYAIGISIAWVLCSSLWTSSWNTAKEFINLFLPKNKILIKQSHTLEIIHATYGSQKAKVEVTQILRKMVINDKLTVRASNEIAGDPDHGVTKQLVIAYRIGQSTTETTTTEGTEIAIPRKQ